MNINNHIINNIDTYYNFIKNKSLDKLINENLDIFQDINNIILYGNNFYSNIYCYRILNNHLEENIDTNTFIFVIKKFKINYKEVEFEYYYTKNFYKIDLSKYYNNSQLIISKFIKNIILNKRIDNKKHIFILDNFHLLNQQTYSNLRVIFEQYTNNVIFICLASTISSIPDFMKSRTMMIRCPVIYNLKIFNNFVLKILEDYKEIYYELIDAQFIYKMEELCSNIDNENNFHTDDELYKIEFDFYKNLKDDLLIQHNIIQKLKLEDLYIDSSFNPFKILTILDCKLQHLIIDIIKIKTNKIKIENFNFDNELNNLLEDFSKNSISIENNVIISKYNYDKLNNIIKQHIDYLKKNKNIIKIIQKNKGIIYKLKTLTENNKIILENYLNYLINSKKQLLKNNESNINKIITLTSKIDTVTCNNSIKNNHFLEFYFLEIFKLIN
jgi:hypothetical protein